MKHGNCEVFTDPIHWNSIVVGTLYFNGIWKLQKMFLWIDSESVLNNLNNIWTILDLDLRVSQIELEFNQALA